MCVCWTFAKWLMLHCMHVACCMLYVVLAIVDVDDDVDANVDINVADYAGVILN